MKGLLAICLVLLVVSAHYCVHANQDKFQCTPKFLSSLKDCEPFLIGNAQKPTQPCCSAVQGLGKLFQGKDKKQRVDICNCVKENAKKWKMNPVKAKQIPKFCQVNIPIDPNFDCNKA